MLILLAAVHFIAFAFFALNYLRFDAGIQNSSSAYKMETAEALIHLEKKLKLPITPSSPEFDRFAFVLLDAWRWDFLLSPSTPMSYLKNKLINGEALATVSLARIPTVTKPSLKSIFSGSFPVFFELVENIDESSITVSVNVTQDNLLDRLYSNGKKICLYADDVWSKLFPLTLFHRYKVDYGLNIMDYTNVDNMVKDGFKEEKQHADSDVLLFHFLGLDHIGHAFSARKDLVGKKLEEYDLFVSDLQKWLEEDDAKSGRRTLTLVMGDHGMTLDGNHGGGSPEETRAAAVFMASNMKLAKEFDDWNSAVVSYSSKSVHQEDIAATLTSLLDTGKPLSNGFGKLIPDLISAVDSSEALFYKNFIHMLQFPFKKKGSELDSVFREILISEAIGYDDIVRWSEALKQSINSAGFQYDDKKLIFVLSFMLIIAIISIVQLIRANMTFSLSRLLEFVFLALHCLAQSTTSFIAEEQVVSQLCFPILFVIWFATSFPTFKHIESLLAILFINRILMSWSSVGTLWRSSISISDFVKSHEWLQVGSVVLSLLLIAVCLIKRKCPGSKATLVALGFANFSTFLNKIELFAFHRVLTARLCLFSVLYLVLIERSYACLTYLLIVLNRPTHALAIVILFIMFGEMNRLQNNSKYSFSPLLIMSLALNSFYALGLWNSVSAVDLTFGAAFTSSFDMRIAPLVLSSYFFSGPLLAFFCAGFSEISMLIHTRVVLDFFACFFAFQHRYHSWIFDFFAPKVLFQLLWSAFFVIVHFSRKIQLKSIQ